MSLRVLQTGADFELHGGNANLLYTGTFLFVLLFALEYATNVLADVFLADDKELKNPLIRKKICRNLNEFLAMMFMVWLGYESFVENGRFSPFVHGVGVDDVRKMFLQTLHSI